MGPPAAPSAHPHNQRAATWIAGADDVPGPYWVAHEPVEKPSGSPMETILELFNTWTKKAETVASNVWLNLKTAPSKTEAAWGKLGLAAKAISEGGFESLYKQTFNHTDPNEKLKKTFACYLSTTTGPVAGTLYLSNLNVAFCSDRPLSFTAPSGQEAWSYYKVMIPLGKIATVNPVTLKENPPEKYIQIVTVDGHEFWFMGFVNYDKASAHLLEAVSTFRPPPSPLVQPVTGKSKHYGFIEFENPEVAKVVAGEIHGYLLFEHQLQIYLIPPERVHPKLWNGISRRYKPLHWREIERKRHNKERTVEEHQRLVERILKRDEKCRKMIEATGIDYDCPDFEIGLTMKISPL